MLTGLSERSLAVLFRIKFDENVLFFYYGMFIFQLLLDWLEFSVLIVVITDMD